MIPKSGHRFSEKIMRQQKSRMSRSERLTKTERDQTPSEPKPRDAATLIVVDRSGRRPRCCSASAMPA